jgi:hypothetical protein
MALRNRVRRDDAPGAGGEQGVVGIPGEDAVYREHQRRAHAGLGEQAAAFDQRAAGGNHVIEQHRRAIAMDRVYVPPHAHAAIAAAVLFQHQPGAIQRTRRPRHPLRALGVGADEQRRRDVRAHPIGEQSGGRQVARRYRVELVQRRVAVKVRVHGQQGVEMRIEQRREMPRAHRLARFERAVLAHVRQVGRHQRHAARTLGAQRCGHEQQFQRACVRPREIGQHRHLGTAHIRQHADIRLAVRERAQFVFHAGPSEPCGQGRAERVAAQVEQHLHRTGSSMLSVSGCDFR